MTLPLPLPLPLTLLLFIADADPRPIHGSVAVGGDLVAYDAEDDHWRLDGQIDVSWSRLGALISLRAADKHHGLLTGGLTYELGAARPHLVLQAHADGGWDLDHATALMGGGLRGVLGIYGPLSVVIDSGAYVVFQPRVVLTTAAMLAIAW